MIRNHESYILNVALPSGLEAVPSYLFENSKVKNVSIPNTVKRLGYRAF